MYTAGEISIEHVNVFLGTYISKDAIHMTFLSATTHLHLPGGWQEIHLKDFPTHGSVHCSFNYMKSASTSRWETTPCQDVSTSKLHCWWSVIRVMRSAIYPPNMVCSMTAKKLHFGLVRPDNILPVFSRLVQMLFSKLFCKQASTCLFLRNGVLRGERP